MMPRERIIDHVSTLLNSEPFVSSPRLVEFLRFCVDATLSGEEESLKETTIGVSVFGRPPDYDTKLDPIVRVNARRLRQKLDLFYQESKISHSVQLVLPKGSYIPRFELREPSNSEIILPFPESFEEAITSNPSVNTTAPILPENILSGTSTYKRRDLHWLMSAFALTALAMVLILAHTSKLDVVPTFQATGNLLHPMTSLPGTKSDPAISSDNKILAFLWDPDESGISHVYLQSKTGSTPTPLTRISNPEVRFAWSGDGKSIALLRMMKPTTYQLVLIDITSRSERILRTFQFSYTLDRPALDWSRNGKWLVESEQDGAKPVHLVAVSAADGSSKQITDPPDGSTGDLEARFSPDGKEVAFRRGQLGELFLTSVASESGYSPIQLTFSNPGVRGISWSPDASYIYFGSTNGGKQPAVWRYDRSNKNLTMITPDGLAAISPSVNLDGDQILFSAPLPQLALSRYELGHRSISTLFSMVGGLQITPSISPDGKTIAFTSDISGTMELWSSPIENPSPHRLTKLNGDGIPLFPSWSADGQKITYFCRKNGLNYAFEIPASGGDAHLLRGGSDYTLYPQYSPDRKWLYYLSNAGGRFRVWRLPLINLESKPQEVTMQDGRFFRLSADGRGLYYSSPTGATTILIYKDLITEDEKKVWEWAQAPIGPADWDISENQLYYISVDPVKLVSHLFTVNLKSQSALDLGRVLTNYWYGITSVAASPDGKSAWISKVDHDDGNVMSLLLQSKSPVLAQLHSTH